MRRSRTTLYLLATDWIILVGTFAIALYFRQYDKGMNIVSRSHIVPEMVFLFFYAFATLGVFSSLSLYKRKVLLSPFLHFIGIIKAVGITLLAYELLKSLFKNLFNTDFFTPSHFVLLNWSVLLFIALCINRLLVVRALTSLLARAGMQRRVVVIGDTETARIFIEACQLTPHGNLTIVGVMDNVDETTLVKSVPFLGRPEALPDLVELHKLEGAVICNPTLSYQKLIDLIEQCIRLFNWVDIHSEKSTSLQCSSNADAVFDIPFVRLHGIPNNHLYKSWKRSFDFIAALGGILVLSPLLIIVAIIIKKTSPGPIFYVKERVGRDGRLFSFYKFRSMAVGADQDESRNDQIKAFIQDQNRGEKLGKVINTAYVTPIGKFIRKWAIDELPQLYNVLKGDMALVGPRPVPPGEYEMEDEWHQRRFRISPGCTGLWKIYATRTGVTFNDTVLYDIFYARNMNPALDLMVIFGTVLAILKGRADG